MFVKNRPARKGELADPVKELLNGQTPSREDLQAAVQADVQRRQEQAKVIMDAALVELERLGCALAYEVTLLVVPGQQFQAGVKPLIVSR